MALTRLKCAVLFAGAAMFAIGSAPASAEAIRHSNPSVSQTAGTNDATDFSSQRRRGGRVYGRRGGGGGGGAAAAAIAAGVIGTAIIASQPRGYGYYDRPYGYGGYGPRYYGGPGYYDGGW